MIAPVIGLLGGSFDPVHVGHLQLARDALAHLPLDEVRFVPAAQPWQKGRITDAAHRVRMVELAIAREPRCVLDRQEIERGGPTYTVDTLRALRAGAWRDASLVLVMGSDQFERFDTWREWEAIADLAHRAAGAIVEFPMTPVDASATEARRLLASPAPEAGRRLAQLLPAAVLDYIRAHRLYG